MRRGTVVFAVLALATGIAGSAPADDTFDVTFEVVDDIRGLEANVLELEEVPDAAGETNGGARESDETPPRAPVGETPDVPGAVD